MERGDKRGLRQSVAREGWHDVKGAARQERGRDDNVARLDDSSYKNDVSRLEENALGTNTDQEDGQQ